MKEYNRHSLWARAQRWFNEDVYFAKCNKRFRETFDSEYWWGAFNIENCKSANNKNCYMAMCRAAKNKSRIFRLYNRTLRIRNRKLT